MMFSKTVVFSAICCLYFEARTSVVSSFAFLPSPSRPSVVSRGIPLFGKSKDKVQREDEIATVPQKEEEEEDGLNVEKFQADLEEFAIEEETLVVEKSDTKKDLELQSKTLPFKFRGEYDIHAEVTLPPVEWAVAKGFSADAVVQNLPVVVLVHGFGASTVYWRKTVEALALQGYAVYAMDLLGHGKSAKPTKDIEYSTALWAEQLDDFCASTLTSDEDIVLIGNSVGSLVSLMAASGTVSTSDDDDDKKKKKDARIQPRLRGIGMFNCGIGLNVHGITRDPKWNPLQRFFLNAVFKVMESKAFFGNVPLVRQILDRVAKPKVLRAAFRKLYGRASDLDRAVDDDLIESFVAPVAGDPDATAKILSQILTNDAGPTPMEVHAGDSLLTRHLPIHVVWGDSDDVTPLDGIGGVAQFYQGLATDEAGVTNNKVTMDVVPGGHLLFDEVPDVANGAMVKWLNDL